MLYLSHWSHNTHHLSLKPLMSLDFHYHPRMKKQTNLRLKGCGFESLHGWRENFLLQGQLSVLTLVWVSVHPRVTAVACKRSFCQKCRWLVTAKHACTLRMWLCMKWHGARLYGVHRTCAETAAVSCGTSHASAVSTPLRWIFKRKTRYIASHSCGTTCERNESAQESGE